MRRLAWVTVVALAACGSDDKKNIDASTGTGDGAVDATPADAAPPDATTAVVRVDCATVTPVMEVTTTGFAFTPDAVTINANDVVKFTPGAGHNVIPHPTLPTDPGLSVGFNDSRCLRFTTVGTFNWRCQPHSQMTGAVTVQ